MRQAYFLSLEEAISALYGSSAMIAKKERLSGGDINDSYKLTLTDGHSVFMKTNAGKGDGFFAAEVAGLNAIAATGAAGTPQILGCGKSFLLLELIDGKKRVSNYWETLGHELADMHKADTARYMHGGRYGFDSDNYIGESPQINTPHESWITFFRDCRLAPQFRRAAGYFDSEDFRRITRLMEHLEKFLAEPEYPSLLHGDLWAGNVMTGNDGRAWLIDPAVYVGHAEADIAMTELFGGFPEAFYAAYREAGVLSPDYKERRDLYNLYHLLNHLNLFGGGYLSSVRRIVGKYVM